MTLILLAAKAAIFYLLLLTTYHLLSDTALLVVGNKDKVMAIQWHVPAILAVILYLLNQC